RLFSFDIPFNRPTNLASLSGDTLTLNIGPNAANRLNGDISDGNESIVVESDGNDIIVWSNQFNRPRSAAQRFPASQVHKIVADGGAGDDVIDLPKVTAAIPAELQC